MDSGKKVGRYQGICTTVRPPATSDCSFTLSLPGGQVRTHSYRAARGEVVAEETSDTTGKLTIHLVK